MKANETKTREISAYDLWVYMCNESDDIINLLVRENRVFANIDINISGSNYEYYKNCLNIVNYFFPQKEDAVSGLVSVSDYAIKNGLIDYKQLVIRDDVVRNEKIVKAVKK